MKTVFITIFEGVESKNILRTSILPTLLGEPNIRLVLITKSNERAEYHKREFNDPRIVYEVVEVPEVLGLDRIFMKLRYFLLNTGSSWLWRQMLFEERRNHPQYYLGSFLKTILARPGVVKVFRRLDYLLVRDYRYRTIFEKYNPDLVFVANLFGEHEIHLVREAKRRKIKTIGLINSWDRVTARSVLRLIPDKLIVFNNLVSEEVVEHNGISRDQIFVSGIPQYDKYFAGVRTPREVFFRKKGLDSGHKLIVFSPQGGTFSNSDWDIIDLMHKLHVEGRFGSQVSILVRFPPNDYFDPQEFKKRTGMIYDYPGTRFSEIKGTDWDMTFEELQNLVDTLYHMSLIVTYASSISVDAAVFDRPVININFELRKSESVFKQPTRYYKKTHYQKALKTGGIRLVNNEEELVEWVNAYLKDSSVDSEKRKLLVSEQCVYLDGGSGKRIGDFILSYLNFVKS